MTPTDSLESPLAPTPEPRGKPYRELGPVSSVSALGVGMIVGAVIGAGVALLVAPQSGRHTRRAIGKGVDRLRGRGGGAWTRLGRELRKAARIRMRERQLRAQRRERALASHGQ